MLKATILASALELCLAVPARAGEVERIDQTTHRVTTTLPDTVVGVTADRPNPVGTIVGDAIGGAILGGAVGGGVALYNRYGTSNGSWGDWQRDILVGAGIGLGVGLIVGGISAASQSADRTYMSPATERRDVGFSPPMGNYGVRF
jgi:hypothetical protein